MALKQNDATTAYRPTRHLDDLLADVDRLAGLVADGVDADVPAADRLAAERLDRAVAASLALDGAPITDVVAGVSTWLDTLRAPPRVAEATDVDPDRATVADDAADAAETTIGEHTPESTVAVLEAGGVAAGLTSTDLLDPILTAPVATLRELHRRVTRGLVAPERAGADRTLEQAVHDGVTGRIIFRAPPPASLPDALERLDRWVVAATQRGEHPLVVSGVLHLEVLSLHPFDAANGRVARAAARLALRAQGGDPHGLACPEPWLATDPLGYHEEVASSRYRRDAAIWLERWGEAVTAGLREVARALGMLPSAPVDAPLPPSLDERFTVREHQDATGLSAAAARAQLRDLLDTGWIEWVPGSRGLRVRSVERTPVD